MDAKNALSKSHKTTAFHHQAFLNNINSSKKKIPRTSALSPLRYTRRPVSYSPTRSRGQLRSVFSIREDRVEGEPSETAPRASEAEPSSLREVESAPRVREVESAPKVREVNIASSVEPSAKVASLVETIVQQMDHSPLVRKASSDRSVVAIPSVIAKVSRATSPICLMASSPKCTAEQKCQTEDGTETELEGKEDTVTPSKILNHFKCKHGEKNISERLLDSYRNSFDEAYREFMQSRHDASERDKKETLDASLTKHTQEAKKMRNVHHYCQTVQKEDVDEGADAETTNKGLAKAKQIQTNSSSESFSKHPIIQNLSLSGYGPHNEQGKFLNQDTSQEVLESPRRQKSNAHADSKCKSHEDPRHMIKIECANFEGPSRCNFDEDTCGTHKNWRVNDGKRRGRIVRADSEDTDRMRNFDNHGLHIKNEIPYLNHSQKPRFKWEEFERHGSCIPSPRVCDYYFKNVDSELPSSDSTKHNVRIECENFEQSSPCCNEKLDSHTSNRCHKPRTEADERQHVQKVHQRRDVVIESEASDASRKGERKHHVRFELEDTDDTRAKPSRKLKSPRLESDSSLRHHSSCHCRECQKKDLKSILKHHDKSFKTTANEEVYPLQKKLQRSKLTCNRFHSSSYQHSAPVWNCRPEGPRIAPVQSESDFEKNAYRRNEIAEMLYQNFKKYSFDTTSDQILSQDSWRSVEVRNDRSRFSRHLERGDGLKECSEQKTRDERSTRGKRSPYSSYANAFNAPNSKTKPKGRKKKERKGIVRNIRDMISTWPHPSNEDDWECRSDEDKFKFPKETKKAVMIMMQESQSPRSPRKKNSPPRSSNSSRSTASSRNLPCTKNLLCEKGEHTGNCGKQDSSQSSDKQKVCPAAAKRYPLAKNENSGRSFPKLIRTSCSGGPTPIPSATR